MEIILKERSGKNIWLSEIIAKSISEKKTTDDFLEKFSCGFLKKNAHKSFSRKKNGKISESSSNANFERKIWRKLLKRFFLLNFQKR